jgi:hypothetical protein
MSKFLVLLVIFAGLSLGCSHAQVTPTPHSVTLTWTAPPNPTNPPAGAWTGCGTPSTCSYVVSRATGTTCPAFVYNATAGGSGNYTPLNESNPTSLLTFVDSAPVPSSCYLVQTTQNGEYSGASNIVGPFTTPVNPSAPVVNSNATTAKSTPPPTGNVGIPTLTAKLNP